jgi:exodeoxyribonuclease-3
MKIITWNCNMALRKKAGFILTHQPDILIVPECEHPDKLAFPDTRQKPTGILWFGKNPHKGLGIFSFNSYKICELEGHNRDLKLIVPISVSRGRFACTLFAIWAFNPDDAEGKYVEQVWKAVHHYETLLTGTRTILAGDFNSNTIWDRKNRAANHSSVVQFLETRGIRSAYHMHHNQTQGKEAHPTFYLYRHRERSYHIDYCFLSADLAKKIMAV